MEGSDSSRRAAALRLRLPGGAYACATPGGLPCSDCAHFRHAALLGLAGVSGARALIGRLLSPSGGRKPAGLWSSSLRGCIASPFRAGRRAAYAWARSLAVPRPRLAPPWVANPCGGGNHTRFPQSSFTAHSDRSPSRITRTACRIASARMLRGRRLRWAGAVLAWSLQRSSCAALRER